MSYDVKQVIVVRKDLQMRKGKMCAQVAHASMKFLLDNNEPNSASEINVKLSEAERIWLASGFPKIVVGCNSEQELLNLIDEAELKGISVHPIIDSGFTEFHGVKTLTCAAFGPNFNDEIDGIVGHLKLL